MSGKILTDKKESVDKNPGQMLSINYVQFGGTILIFYFPRDFFSLLGEKLSKKSCSWTNLPSKT